MIPVSRPYLPNRAKFEEYINAIYDSHQLTNNGPLHEILEARICQHLELDPEKLILASNGTLALQLAFKGLQLKGNIITTPFSFVASTSSMVWEGLTPLFADINPETFNIDSNHIPPQITTETSAILPVHVFGNACDIGAIEEIAHANKLKVVYDASHCFGTTFQGKSILEYGDISTISFHATKLFHTVEGGALYVNDLAIARKIRQMARFGADECGTIVDIGINAKLSDVHAAMGLAVLDDKNIWYEKRKAQWERYNSHLSPVLRRQKRVDDCSNNHSYFPILFEDEASMLTSQQTLRSAGIESKRYFYPSLSTLPYLENGKSCRISDDVASRILCLPLFFDLKEEQQMSIIKILNRVVS